MQKIAHLKSHDTMANGPLARKLEQVEAHMRAAHQTHLGYPYNLSFEPGLPASLNKYLINNLGDPYTGSHYASEVCALEREAIAWLMNLWECGETSDFWGSIGASGTEGNFWGIYLGREALPDAVLFHSAEAHYSVPKAARIQRIETREIASNANGEIDLPAFSAALGRLGVRPVIVVLTCGTTMKGAHDEIDKVISLLDAAGIGRGRRYIHVDGALNAMVIPFVKEAPFGIRPSFRHAIDSISASGHKMIGTPMPCGGFVCRKEHSDRIASAISYLRSNDTTLMGSRNGHAVLAVWSRLFGHGVDGYTADVKRCIAGARQLAARMRAMGVPVLLNRHSLTVVFPQPAESVVKTYQLACYRGQAHAIVMPNVTEMLIEQFLDDYANWWSTLNSKGHRSELEFRQAACPPNR